MGEEKRKRRREERTKSDKRPRLNTLCFAYHEFEIGLGFLDSRVGGLDELSGGLAWVLIQAPMVQLFPSQLSSSEEQETEPSLPMIHDRR